MEWIIKVANERNEERHRRDTIARGAPTVWDNICRSIEQALRSYRQLERALPVEFSGCANHTIWVATFEGRQTPEKGSERERVTIIFNQEKLEVEVHQSSDQTSYRSFSIDLNSSGQVCLMDDKKELSIEKFTEMALRGLLFPREF